MEISRVQIQACTRKNLKVKSVCLYVCLSVYLSVCMSVCQYFCLYVCLSVFLSVYLYVCLHIGVGRKLNILRKTMSTVNVFRILKYNCQFGQCQGLIHVVSFFLLDKISCPRMLDSEGAFLLKHILQHQKWRDVYSLELESL